MTKLRQIPIVGFVAMLAWLPATSFQHAQAQTTSSCNLDAPDAQLLACAKSLPDESPEQLLVYANLGTRAMMNDDRALAAQYYQHTLIKGKTVLIDATFHAFRSVAFHSVGQDDLARDDAHVALDMIKAGKIDLQGGKLTPEREAAILGPLLDTLFALKDSEANNALALYLALPTSGWPDSANRSAVLAQAGRYTEAMPYLDEALKAQPGHPALLNNKCDLMVKLQRTADALPLCEAAVAAQPAQPAFWDTYADALNAAGKCPAAIKARNTASSLFPDNPKYRKKLSCEAN